MNNQELLLTNTDLISDAVKEYVDQKVNECIPKSGYRNRLDGYQLASYIQPSSNQITISYSSNDICHLDGTNLSSNNLTINLSGDNLATSEYPYVVFKHLFIFKAESLTSINFNLVNGITQVDYYAGQPILVDNKVIYFFEFFFHDITVSIGYHSW